MAEFHASTYYLCNSYPGGKDAFLADHKILKGLKPFDATTKKAWRQAVTQVLEGASWIAKEYLGQEIADKVMGMIPYSFNAFMDARLNPYGNFQTIIHGDSWANNAMFK